MGWQLVERWVNLGSIHVRDSWELPVAAGPVAVAWGVVAESPAGLSAEAAAQLACLQLQLSRYYYCLCPHCLAGLLPL